jgi:hypothetical protein
MGAPYIYDISHLRVKGKEVNYGFFMAIFEYVSIKDKEGIHSLVFSP